MRENDLLAPSRVGSPRGPRSHDGTIIPEMVDTISPHPERLVRVLVGTRLAPTILERPESTPSPATGFQGR
jgi:hypothetical protein